MMKRRSTSALPREQLTANQLAAVTAGAPAPEARGSFLNSDPSSNNRVIERHLMP